MYDILIPLMLINRILIFYRCLRMLSLCDLLWRAVVLLIYDEVIMVFELLSLIYHDNKK